MATNSDNFNRASLGSNWTQDRGSWSISSNQLASGGGGGTTNHVFYNVEKAEADGYSQCTTHNPAGNHYVGPSFRGSSGGNCYYVAVKQGSASYIAKMVGGTQTLLSSNLGGTAVSGDTLRIEATGTTLDYKVNGTSQGTVTDSTFSGEDYAGIYANNSSGVLDNWEATGQDVDPPDPTPSGAVSYRRTHMTGNVHR